MSAGNPAAHAKENAAAYINLLLGLLGDQDPLVVQESQIAWLVAETYGLLDADLRRPEKPGKWSIIQVVQHLADSELIYGYRMRMVLSHPTPDIQGYDQDLWAEQLKFNEANLADALEQFRALRTANLRLARWLTPEQLARFGNHSERGAESVERMIKMMAGHDILHRNQITRIKRAVGVE